MTLLAIESSCDESSAAVVQDGRVLSCPVSSQIKLHAEYGGVVPELAAREHLRNLPTVVRLALAEAGFPVTTLQAVAATRGPGLPAALLAGYKLAQGMSFSLGVPLYGIHHHEAHLYSPWVAGQPACADFAAFQPNVSLIVSGGHTLLVLVRAEGNHTILGATLDDAAGECFDKTAKILGLPYPGGPELDRLAREGDPKAFSFPRPLLHSDNHDFSFSGLKTSVRYLVRDRPDLLQQGSALRDLCASIQAAIVEVLVAKTLRAAHRCRVACITASGGVTCNSGLRTQLSAACQAAGVELRLASRALCTDNAAMVGLLAERKAKRGEWPDPIDAEVEPSWPLERICGAQPTSR